MLLGSLVAAERTGTDTKALATHFWNTGPAAPMSVCDLPLRIPPSDVVFLPCASARVSRAGDTRYLPPPPKKFSRHRLDAHAGAGKSKEELA